MMKYIKVIALLICLLVPAVSWGAPSCAGDTCTADTTGWVNSVANPNIQDAVDACVADGGCTKVRIPSGTWNVSKTITIPSTKAILFYGDGVDVTILDDNCGTSAASTDGTVNYDLPNLLLLWRNGIADKHTFSKVRVKSSSIGSDPQ